MRVMLFKVNGGIKYATITSQLSSIKVGSQSGGRDPPSANKSEGSRDDYGGYKSRGENHIKS